MISVKFDAVGVHLDLLGFLRLKTIRYADIERVHFAGPLSGWRSINLSSRLGTDILQIDLRRGWVARSYIITPPSTGDFLTRCADAGAEVVQHPVISPGRRLARVAIGLTILAVLMLIDVLINR